MGEQSFHNAAKRCKMPEADPSIEKEINPGSKITHYNQPVEVEVYHDPVTESEKVIILACLLGPEKLPSIGPINAFVP